LVDLWSNQSPENFATKGNIFYMVRRYEGALIRYKKAAILSSNKAVYLRKIKLAEFQIDVRRNEEIPKGEGKFI
jgi:hypothetical protein